MIESARLPRLPRKTRLSSWFGFIALSAGLGALSPLACSRVSEPAGASASAASSAPSASPSSPAAPSRKARAEAATNTRDIIAAISKDCLSCAEKSGCFEETQQGGVCETVKGTAKSGATEAALCIKALQCVVGSKCANVGHETPCLCGSTDLSACIAGQAPPTGPCVSQFAEDFGSNGKTMYDLFIDQKYGAGRANSIIQCAVQSCDACKAP